MLQQVAEAMEDRLEACHIKWDRAPTTRNAAWMARNLCYGNKGHWPGALWLICAGYDPHKRKAELYSVAPSGALFSESRFAVVGSGADYVLGYCDAHLGGKEGDDDGDLPSRKECVDHVRAAVGLATRRDSRSGGEIELCVVDDHGAVMQSVRPS